MAYDLLLRRQIPRNCSRENIPTSFTLSTLIGLSLVGAVHLLPRLLRQGEIHYYRRKLADNRADITQEMPAITMYELSKARKYPRQ